MAHSPKPPVETAALIAWVAATQGIALAEMTAALTTAEMEPPLERALAALEGYDIEGDIAEFRAVLVARAEQAP